jgi:hypothetical protein
MSPHPSPSDAVAVTSASADDTRLSFGPSELPIALLHVTGDHVLAAFADLPTARAAQSALFEQHNASGADPNLEPFEYQLVDARTGRPPPHSDDDF